ncbi:MAG: cellulase family glycosylhydrolase [Bacteroidales bacterium]|nr:cellulase family glycosylhydrolase [Bacteroidales bacterium]
MMKWLLITGLLLFSILSLKAQDHSFISINDHTFQLEEKPYYYIGANYWYGTILASPTGDRPRLERELDFMKQCGIDNLRIQVGAEGPAGEPFRVTPVLQISPGVYNEDMLDGLDYLMAELGKRDMKVILFLNNSWDWSGGFAQYLNWNGYGNIPYPMVKPNTWQEFMQFSGQFLHCDNCMKQYKDFVTFILSRTNRYSGLKYIDDPAIMTWEIGNEPRAFSTENIPALKSWVSDVAAHIKQLDPNHLVTTGTEGQHGCEKSLEFFEQIHADPNIDYLTMHIWPKNWSWLDIKNIPGTLQLSIDSTNQYMERHFKVARKLGKPIVLEEFGLPRDFHGYQLSETTNARDEYYRNAFNQVVEHAKTKDVLAGCNFWGMGGEGRPSNLYWKPADDYVGDPPNEEQGLNSVFDTDSRIQLINVFNKKLSEVLKKSN